MKKLSFMTSIFTLLIYSSAMAQTQAQGLAPQPPKASAPPVQPVTNQSADETEGNLPVEGALIPGAKASAQVESKSGSQVSGEVQFTETATGIRGHYKLTGLPKNKSLGFHIHEKGDCSAKDAKSAGRHYHQIAPTGGTSLDNPEKYAGDLPMIKSNEKGEASGTFSASGLTVNKKNAIIKRAIIVHEDRDDISKKSAARIACGVIK